MNATAFPTRKDSPFPDGYDLAAVIASIADLYHAENPDPTDPRYPTLSEVWEREEQLKQIVASRKRRQFAQSDVPDDLAAIRPGRLRQNASFQVHTLDAQRLWLGQVPAEGRPGINGVARFANTLYFAFQLTAADNPLADWVLIRTEDEFKAIEAFMAAKMKVIDQLVQRRRERGFQIGVVSSDRPIQVEVNFGSPYGYKAVEIVLTFDLYVRWVRALEQTGMLPRPSAQALIQESRTRVRHTIEETVRYHQLLTQAPGKTLTRAHLASDDAAIREMVSQIDKQLRVPIPDEVRSGRRRPEHFRPLGWKRPGVAA